MDKERITVMDANQAIKIWHERGTTDALQSWEISEMLDALTTRVEELEAAQSTQADEKSETDSTTQALRNLGDAIAPNRR